MKVGGEVRDPRIIGWYATEKQSNTNEKSIVRATWPCLLIVRLFGLAFVGACLSMSMSPTFFLPSMYHIRRTRAYKLIEIVNRAALQFIDKAIDAA